MKSLWNNRLAIIFVLLLGMMLSGCASEQEQTKNGEGKSSNHKKIEETSEQQAFPVTLTDASGKKVKIKKQPEKIVSLLPSNTEILFAVGAGKSVVGVTTNDNYPAAVKELPTVGGFKISVEKVLALDPDLVLAQQINKDGAIKKLRQAGVTVYVLKNPTSFAGVYHSITTVGQITGHAAKAETVIQDMKSTIADVKKRIKSYAAKTEKTVWVEISAPPNIYTTGSGTFMHEMITIIGAKNAAGSLKGYPKVSEEQAIKYNPDVIVLTYGNQKTVEKVLNREGWQSVSAIKNKNVYTLPTNLVSRPGPRLAKGVVELAKVVYPKAFNN